MHSVTNRGLLAVASLVLGGVAMFVFTSCATIVRGSSQDLKISSTPTNARVLVDDEDRGSTPTTLTLDRGDDYQITFQKEGYEDETVNIDQDFKIGWPIFGNIFSWGIIGIIVDVANGSAYQLTPEQVEAALGEGETARLRKNRDENGVHVVLMTKEEIGQRVDLSHSLRLSE